MDPVDHRARLQSGHEKDHAVDHIEEEVPEEDALQTRRGADQPGTVPTDVKPRRHPRQHARAAQILRRPIGDERRQDRQHDLDARFVHPMAQAQHHPADADAPENLTHNDRGEHGGRVAKRKRARTHGGYGEAVEDERRRIVGEAFAFEDHGDASWKFEIARDGKGRHGIRRRDDGAQHESHRPIEAQQKMRDRRNDHRGEEDGADGEKRDRAQVEAELPPAHRHRRPIDDGRQHQEQHEFGRQRHFRQAWDQRQHHAGQHQKNGRRNLQPFGKDRHRRDHDQQQHQNLDCNDHRRSARCPPWAATRNAAADANYSGRSNSVLPPHKGEVGRVFSALCSAQGSRREPRRRRREFGANRVDCEAPAKIAARYSNASCASSPGRAAKGASIALDTGANIRDSAFLLSKAQPER